MRLLLLEDDALLGEGLRDFLRSEGHVVDWFRRLSEVRGLGQEPFDLVLVDWNMPDGSGIEWLAGLRRQGKDTPAIVLTARDRLADRIAGLDGGADDYLVKPFAPEELAARIRALGRRRSTANLQRWTCGAVTIDLHAHQAWVDQRCVELTSREWAVLEALLLRAGRLVTKSDLEALVSGFNGESSSNTIEVHISRLRRKLVPGIIETVRGMGYRIAT